MDIGAIRQPTLGALAIVGERVEAERPIGGGTEEGGFPIAALLTYVPDGAKLDPALAEGLEGAAARHGALRFLFSRSAGPFADQRRQGAEQAAALLPNRHSACPYLPTATTLSSVLRSIRVL